MVSKVKHGSKHFDNRDDMCCPWNLHWLRKLENSSGFLIVTSMALFDLDSIDIGFPFTDVCWVDSVVMSPGSEKLFDVLLGKRPFVIWCALLLDPDLLIYSRTALSEGLLSTVWFLSNIESLFSLSLTYLLNEEISFEIVWAEIRHGDDFYLISDDHIICLFPNCKFVPVVRVWERGNCVFWFYHRKEYWV